VEQDDKLLLEALTKYGRQQSAVPFCRPTLDEYAFDPEFPTSKGRTLWGIWLSSIFYHHIELMPDDHVLRESVLRDRMQMGLG